MSLLFLSVVYLSFASWAGASNAQCGRVDNGIFMCSIPGDPKAVEIIDNQLFVGIESRLLVFSLPVLQQSHSVNLTSSASTVSKCGFASGGLGQPPEQCVNSIRTIQPYMDGEVMVCGTNAHHPQCNIHETSDPSTYRKLSPPEEIDTGFAPEAVSDPFQSVLASNKKFYAATRFSVIEPGSIQMAPGALANDTTFTVRTQRNNQNWLNQPNFVSVHENGDYIYFFLTELALEVQDIENVIYSRAVRICKTDIGVGQEGRNNHFLTFQKARIFCTDGPQDSIPFTYNNIASTFLGRNEDDAPILYATFNSPVNGPAGGAICKFTFDTQSTGISSIFDDVNYRVKNTDNGIWEKNSAPDFDCPGQTGGTERSASDVLTYHLKFNPINEQQLYVSSMAFLDKITAETVQYMEVSQEIIYFSNERGDIMQTVLVNGEKFSHTIFQPNSEKRVGTLILHRDSSTTGSLIAAYEGQIIQIPRGQCSRYTDCFSCFDSRDPYCGWNQTSQSCVNKFEQSNPANLIEAFNHTALPTICGDRLPTQPTSEPVTRCPPNIPPTNPPSTNPPSTNPDPVEIATIDTSKDYEDCVTVPPQTSDIEVVAPVTDGLTGAKSSSVGIPVVVGASIGAFLFGVILGGLVCIFFSKQCALVFSKLCTHRLKSSIKDCSPETPGDATAQQQGDEVVTMMQVNNNNQVIEKEDLEKPKLQPPPPRYIQHNPVKPAPDPPAIVTVSTPTQRTKLRSSSTSSLPPAYNHANGFVHPHQLPEELEVTDDNAFADNDTVPPLKTFPSPGTMYGSLGRNKGGMNGVGRRQIPGYKIPRGRSDSTTWLRQRSESLSSDISSSTSPLESPISDV